MSRSLVEMVWDSGGGDLYWKVLLPAALPKMPAGLRLGAIRRVNGS